MRKILTLQGTRPSVADTERKEAPVMSRESADSFLSFLRKLWKDETNCGCFPPDDFENFPYMA